MELELLAFAIAVDLPRHGNPAAIPSSVAVLDRVRRELVDGKAHRLRRARLQADFRPFDREAVAILKSVHQKLVGDHAGEVDALVRVAGDRGLHARKGVQAAR